MNKEFLQAWERFPLLCRPHLHLPDLYTRIETAHSHARAATATTDPGERHRQALNAWNLAALIAADLGHTDLAARWCRDQHTLLARHAPLTGRAAIDALQPLLNLVRLTARQGHPRQAFEDLAALHRGVATGSGHISVHGLCVDLAALLDTPVAVQVLRWTGLAMLQTGTALLMRTRQWERAAVHSRTFDHVGERLGPAHQCSLVESMANRHTDDLFTPLLVTDTGKRAVLGCLRAYAHLAADQGPEPDLEALHIMITSARTTTDPISPLFGVHLTLTLIDLASRTAPGHVDPWLNTLVDEVLALPDARPAHEVLTHPRSQEYLLAAQRDALLARSHAAGLSLPETVPLPSLLEQTAQLAHAVVAAAG
ncbi:hypothetical protein [Nocardiopsis metallicus]|uniref:Uncharacterized protein n=1 Tax=Nocardiopsis metallicus TaxID=179819 RepID=A0A840WF25_9ACTN|nr:hypothetical protein [Nocardiopsis metallicus]MBB5494832.1 hypothetical protein [Nocardiopsis metallicus]